MKELDREYWRKLDADLLAAEAALIEERAWAARDVFEGIGRIAIDPEVVVISPLL